MSDKKDLDRMRRIIVSDGLHIERCLLALATGGKPYYHDLDYAWRALIKLGHEVTKPADVKMKDALRRMIDPVV